MKILQSTVERLLYIVIFVVFIGAALGIGFLYKSNTRLNGRIEFLEGQLKENKEIGNQIKSLVEETKALNEQTKANTDDINRHLDCVVLFFTRENRTELKITDIDSCRVEDGGSTLQLMPTPTQPVPTQQPSIQSQPAQPGQDKNKDKDKKPRRSAFMTFVDNVSNKIKEVLNG